MAKSSSSFRFLFQPRICTGKIGNTNFEFNFLINFELYNTILERPKEIRRRASQSVNYSTLHLRSTGTAHLHFSSVYVLVLVLILCSRSPSPSPSPTPPAMAAPDSVVNIGFCLSHPVDLVIKPNHGLFTKTHHEVFDARGSLIFRVKGNCLSLHQNGVMYDAAGSPILTMRAKVLSLHQKWTVYRGESTKESDVVFRLKTSKYWTTKLNLDVFLPETREEDACDFHVDSRQSNSCCTIYKGSSEIAEMSEGKSSSLAIRVHPEVDYAFIAALMVIYSEMKMAPIVAESAGVVAGTVAGEVAAAIV